MKFAIFVEIKSHAVEGLEMWGNVVNVKPMILMLRAFTIWGPTTFLKVILNVVFPWYCDEAVFYDEIYFYKR